jgi:hypothetical protein
MGSCQKWNLGLCEECQKSENLNDQRGVERCSKGRCHVEVCESLSLMMRCGVVVTGG